MEFSTWSLRRIFFLHIKKNFNVKGTFNMVTERNFEVVTERNFLLGH